MTFPCGFSNGVLCANNVCFDGDKTAKITSDGQLIIGSTAEPKLQIGTIVSTDGSVTITYSHPNINLSVTGTDIPMHWTEITGTTSPLVVNNGYIANAATLITFTLPSIAVAVGDIIRISGKGVGGWLIAQNATQQIWLGKQFSSIGIGGSISSTDKRDAIELVCETAGTASVWNVISSIGNLTIV